MLSEFIQRQNYPPNPDRNERMHLMSGVLYDCLDYLSNPKSTPHRHINSLCSLTDILVSTKTVGILRDTHHNGSINFALVGDKLAFEPAIILPNDFLSLMASNPIFQLSSLVNIASQVRDNHTNNTHDLEAVRRRAQAFEAEALYLLENTASVEGIPLYYTHDQRAYLRSLPSGGLSSQYTCLLSSSRQFWKKLATLKQSSYFQSSIFPD